MRKVTRSQKHGNAWKELKQKHARAANLMDADRRRASELLSAKDSHLTFVLRDIMPRHAHDLESALVNYARRINKI